MANWTPEHSSSLSLLLDDVVGTEEMIAIRKDFCILWDSSVSHRKQYKCYYTGSKSEGLDLPGSDDDFMCDINQKLDMKVIQSLDETPQKSTESIWLMSIENAPPGFAYLQHVDHRSNPLHLTLALSTQIMNGLQHLSSDCIVKTLYDLSNVLIPVNPRHRQGPSIETWLENTDTSQPGIDFVLSIHCEFWPFIAAEWPERPRHYGWPSSRDISTITDFGCHLVAVGHPHSDTKLMHWRISFSVAERTLVWSFNQVQMQCYAIMKIILKEFIKIRRSPQNQVLCSYFIKTFLFWKYEMTELTFWRSDNLRECIKYVLTEFSKCVREGVIQHYFIPNFNLLSVKLTQEAKAELMLLFDIVIQSDIGILRDCRTFKTVWSEFQRMDENKNDILSHTKRRNTLKNDNFMMNIITKLEEVYTLLSPRDAVNMFLSLSCKTQLKNVLVKRGIFYTHIISHVKSCSTNKYFYQVYQIALNGIQCSTDISTCKLWCTILLLMKGEHLLALNIIYNVLSSIPPFAMYKSIKCKTDEIYGNNQLYVDMVIDSDITMIQRARKAWLFDVLIRKDMTKLVPLGIQIELYFCDSLVRLSPYVCTYYLQFLCYHELRQNDNRDRALQHLVDAALDEEQTGVASHSLNLAGHCLLVAGERSRAKNIFWTSDLFSKMTPLRQKYNSAPWYLRNFF